MHGGKVVFGRLFRLEGGAAAVLRKVHRRANEAALFEERLFQVE
jgi:hypothetical protein